MINKTNKRSIVAVALATAFAILVSNASFAQDAVTLDDLLSRVKAGTVQDSKAQKSREASFAQDKANQAKLVADAKKERKRLEAESARLEGVYGSNEIRLANKKEQLNDALGILKELFGTVQGVAGDTRSTLVGSLVSAQYPGRVEKIDQLIKKIAGATQLPTIVELEQLWYFMQQEMTEAGKVVKYTATVVAPDGNRAEQEVVRVGTFNIVTDGQYLSFDSGTETLLILPRQPAGKYTSGAEELQGTSEGFTAFGMDPTGPSGGSYLEALIDSPDLKERVKQGREVGYIIIAIGIVALIISLWRMAVLSMVASKVTSQLKNAGSPNSNNPLGRVLIVSQENSSADTETLELKLHEAVLKETPALEAWVNFIKIVSMVAPLLGLLGTVTGMILTFQALTIFGTGDPKAMAGGISSALVTTVLGLCVAIPTLFLHALVSGKSKRVLHILEEQTAGIIAEQSERQGN